MNILFQFLLLAVGFCMLLKGADFFVDGASGIADRFGIPQLVIGLTIAAMGTSAPEASVSIAAALKGSADITIGNIVGSNILNILIILGITSSIVSIKVAHSTVKYEIPFMIAITVILLGLGYSGNVISLFEGIILLVLFISYLLYLLFMARKNGEKVEESKREPVKKLVFFTILGFALIIYGSNITVDAASIIAKYAGLSERFIGLTVVAFGTSLPELVTSVSAALKDKADIAIGNIVGSNIFNVLFIVGTTAVITPVKFSNNFIPDTIMAIVASIMLFICVAKNKRLGRISGIVMLISYAVYFVDLIC